MCVCMCVSHVILKIFNLFIYRVRGREGEREGEKHHRVVASSTPPTGDLAHNPGMCPDWGSNMGPFGLQAGAQSTEPHQPGPHNLFIPPESHISQLRMRTMELSQQGE